MALIRYGKVLIAFILILFVGSAVAAAPPQMTPSECIACHDTVKEDVYKTSIHGSMFSCTDCHQDIKGAGPHEPAPTKPQCATCHADSQKAYEHGFHAKAVNNGDKPSAKCVDCHGGPHEILPSSDAKSKTNHANVANTCASCHANGNLMAASGHSSAPAKSYADSVHGKAASAGNQKAAVCTDCHGSHDILPANDPQSPIFKFNVPTTCAKCHDGVKNEFMGSIHGKAITRGNWQSPVCTDCHGTHSIKAVADPASPVSAQMLSKSTCARCHEGMRLTQEFGVAGRRSTTYESSYHGLAAQGGSTVVANCASCHGVHNILPSTDPKSMIAPANLVDTCGKCHPGAGPNFVKGKVHIDVPLSADIGSTAVRWTRRFYIGMIAVVIGGMLLHNLIIWRKKALLKKQAQHRIIVRMENAQRYQHLVLMISFITLVLTGFALKYPGSWFATFFGLPETIRGIVHRVAGVALIAVGLYHMYYLVAHRSGRKMLKDMLPVPKDAADVIGTMGYYLGLSRSKPALPRFGYAEKAEYWALIWGTIVMAGTGLALWAKVWFGSILPRWSLDVATAIHFYEAILATLAILVWHFYWIIFDPDVYPMNWAWMDGKMDIELYEEEHAGDHETILAAVEAAGRESAERENSLAEETKETDSVPSKQ
ncbi:MAG TPA: cytochrome b/b6 domain-containing protein [Terriglobales bacterium]|nr:cytochrome b/b6 domain-containing protein [Terriglobales bacterium]